MTRSPGSGRWRALSCGEKRRSETVMKLQPWILMLPICAAAWAFTSAQSAGSAQETKFTPLFNGRDFDGWKVPVGDNGHWKIVDGVIDYDAQSEAAGDKNLWTVREFGDFTAKVDWRIKETPYVNTRVPIIRPDGSHKKDASG